jgi:hypothetical protein
MVNNPLFPNDTRTRQPTKKCFGLTCPSVCFWDSAEHRLVPEFQDILTKEFRKELLDKLGASFFLGSAIYDQPGISLNYENLKSQIDDELLGKNQRFYGVCLVLKIPNGYI